MDISLCKYSQIIYYNEKNAMIFHKRHENNYKMRLFLAKEQAEKHLPASYHPHIDCLLRLSFDTEYTTPYYMREKRIHDTDHIMVKICTFYGLAKSAFMVYHPSINRCKKGRRVRDRGVRQ